MKRVQSYSFILGLLWCMTTAIPAVGGTNLIMERISIEKTTITGIVTTPTGQPIEGASITIKGTKNGVVTNADGRFTIQIDDHDEVLVVTSIGYQSQEVVIMGRTEIDIILTPVTTQMAEIVITGFQKREKSKMIGSVSTITARDLENSGITTVDKALKGKVPGVYVRSISGRPGETGEIIIRGINTMTGNKEPLYVLDGMPLQGGAISGGVNSLLTNGIGNIPPEDIESISILKDATAAAIYGARAANGVVIITTKVGEVGKDYINYSGKVGVTFRPDNKFNFMNSAEKLNYEKEIYEDFHPVYGGRVIQLLNQADNGVISHTEAETQILNLSQINTDWIKELYRPALLHSHNLSMSGGTLKTQYTISLNYQDAEGTLMANKYQTGGLNMKLSRKVSDNLLLNVNMYATLKKNIEGAAALDPFRYVVFANPYEKPYNQDGSYAADMTYRNLSNDITYYSDLNYKNFNMIRELNENTKTNYYGNVRGQLGIEYKIFKNFRYIGAAVMDYTSVHTTDESKAGSFRSWVENWLNSASTQQGMVLPEYNQGFLKEDMGRVINYTLRNSLEYSKSFSKKHFVQLFAANEIGGRTNYQFFHFNPIYLQEYRMAGYPSWNIVNPERYINLPLAKFGGTYFDEDRSVSFIGSGVYSYNDRYVLNANIRSDGVDIIGSKNQFAPLWSTGVRWNAHNEKFFKSHSDIISRLVLSAGYGYRGSINRSVYPFHSYILSAVTYDDVVKASQFIYGNPVLKWERKNDLNLGLELSLFKGRINFETRYFKEKVIDLLDNVELPASVGRTTATVNVGALSNKGWELSTRLEVLKSKNGLWEIGGNITSVKNNLDNVYYDDLPNVARSQTSNIENYSINSWFGYKASHVNPDNGHLMVKAQRLNSSVINNKVVNTYTEEVIDLNTISTADLQSKYRTYNLGQINPNLYGGFNTRIVYKAFELASNYVYAAGNKILGFQDRREGPGGVVDEITASRTNRTKEQMYRWRQPADITNIPYYNRTASSYTSFLVSSDLEDGSYLKCTELALSWRSNPTMLKKSLVKILKASLIANNLFTISNYSGTDPETQTTFGYPTTKSITFSLNVGF